MSDLQPSLFPDLPAPDPAELDRLRNAQAQQTYRGNPGNAAKIAARLQVARAVQRGELERAERCSDCGSSCRTEGHHADYARPLSVVWLCRACHMARHRKPVALLGQLLLPLNRGQIMPRDETTAADDGRDTRAWQGWVLTADFWDLCERAGWIMAATLEAAGANDRHFRGSARELVKLAILEALGARRADIEAADLDRHIRPGAFLSASELSGALGISAAVADAIVLALLDLEVLEIGPPTRFAPWVWWRTVAAMRGELVPW
ncbi:hypothetical protein CLV78_105208 [Aliiruegeria haliotis]|uniref:Uncharacterized protein n=1 Tax=Aliiruegeria haliotis TaxID=1280846 RepID=A0A2T0RPN5_9RHOB|nr:HNH endonuclease signature motif containing protein [Aliiruegeria haliotis]PRY23154.1 hypothetical protein CLV78_105208 [Aliiruegeria haliotis]